MRLPLVFRSKSVRQGRGGQPAFQAVPPSGEMELLSATGTSAGP